MPVRPEQVVRPPATPGTELPAEPQPGLLQRLWRRLTDWVRSLMSDEEEDARRELIQVHEVRGEPVQAAAEPPAPLQEIEPVAWAPEPQGKPAAGPAPSRTPESRLPEAPAPYLPPAGSVPPVLREPPQAKLPHRPVPSETEPPRVRVVQGAPVTQVPPAPSIPIPEPQPLGLPPHPQAAVQVPPARPAAAPASAKPPPTSHLVPPPVPAAVPAMVPPATPEPLRGRLRGLALTPTPRSFVTPWAGRWHGPF
ncbi:hypothetical protein ACFP81_03010 [Deinococcus lacus]|uniref:Uncharacterized protein n=1 Tax=Deinococcus lacus TaxID=392561 RepID=A0ABW1YC68_9DEIO